MESDTPAGFIAVRQDVDNPKAGPSPDSTPMMPTRWLGRTAGGVSRVDVPLACAEAASSTPGRPVPDPLAATPDIARLLTQAETVDYLGVNGNGRPASRRQARRSRAVLATNNVVTYDHGQLTVVDYEIDVTWARLCARVRVTAATAVDG